MQHYLQHLRTLLFAVVGLIGAIGSVGAYIVLTDATPPERTEHVFVYGTLTNPIIRFAMCRCYTKLTPATLSDFHKVGLTIIPLPGSTVEGGSIAVSPSELARLDRYERIPTRYRREKVSINEKTVWVYIKND